MSEAPALMPTIERMLFDIRSARYSSGDEPAKLTAWCGYEAWMRVQRDLNLMTANMRMYPSGPAKLTLWGCEFNEDPDQPLNEIWFQSNGAPVRKLDTETMKLETFLGPLGVKALDLAAMAAFFRNGAVKVEVYPRIMSIVPARADTRPEDPIETRSFSVNEWIALGMVYMPSTRTYALTQAGRNAVEQFKAFPQ